MAVRPVALTVAGSDSGGGAGIAADVKTFAAHGVWGAVALTAVTAQNTLGVQAIHPVPAPVVRAQIESVVTDLGCAAAKTGMLGGAEIVDTVAAAIGDLGVGPVVVDPVARASTGGALGDPDVMAAIADRLVPLATVVTPNLAEAGALVGGSIRTPDDMREAARALVGAGAAAALVTGGHAAGARAADCLVLAGAAEEIWLDAPRLDQPHTHGTGCVLSAAIAANLALGSDVESACRSAKRFVTAAIAAGLALGAGIGPVDPGWSRPD